MAAAEVFTILGGVLAGFALIYVGICLGNTYVSKKELNNRFDEFEVRIKKEIAEAFLEVLVDCGVIEDDRQPINHMKDVASPARKRTGKT